VFSHDLEYLKKYIPERIPEDGNVR
jgi:hypothetical protein